MVSSSRSELRAEAIIALQNILSTLFLGFFREMSTPSKKTSLSVKKRVRLEFCGRRFLADVLMAE